MFKEVKLSQIHLKLKFKHGRYLNHKIHWRHNKNIWINKLKLKLLTSIQSFRSRLVFGGSLPDLHSSVVPKASFLCVDPPPALQDQHFINNLLNRIKPFHETRRHDLACKIKAQHLFLYYYFSFSCVCVSRLGLVHRCSWGFVVVVALKTSRTTNGRVVSHVSLVRSQLFGFFFYHLAIDWICFFPSMSVAVEAVVVSCSTYGCWWVPVSKWW